ncbi:MAG: hypothetical protein JRD89_01375 [Deltaproteobacteria bacterium]|nr:hypothetical protein [Deltaproteobacteria bacterium]
MKTRDIHGNEEHTQNITPEAIQKAFADPKVKDIQVYKGAAPTTKLGVKIARERARKLNKSLKRKAHSRAKAAQRLHK